MLQKGTNKTIVVVIVRLQITSQTTRAKEAQEFAKVPLSALGGTDKKEMKESESPALVTARRNVFSTICTFSVQQGSGHVTIQPVE